MHEIRNRSFKIFFQTVGLKLIGIGLVFFILETKAQADFDYYFVPAKKNPSQESVGNNYYTPASLVKLVTAAQALFTFGGDYRFSTKVYLTDKNELGFEGSGDPALTSEKLRDCFHNILRPLVANKIAIQRIIIDDSKFDQQIKIPGQGDSANPYDAGVGALAINFNSIAINVTKEGVETGEYQTPLTNLGKQLGKSLPVGKHRISVKSLGESQRQFFELASFFLNQLKLPVKDGYLVRPIPLETSKLLGVCYSDPLEILLSDMLKYSNNFIANQIFLHSGARYFGYPADLTKSSKAAAKFLKEEVGIVGHFVIEEGAGLSRANRLTPDQLMQILYYFEPYKELLPQNQGVFYKSGTLTGVSNLAGYLTNGQELVGYFSLFGSKPMPINERVRLALTKAAQK